MSSFSLSLPCHHQTLLPAALQYSSSYSRHGSAQLQSMPIALSTSFSNLPGSSNQSSSARPSAESTPAASALSKDYPLAGSLAAAAELPGPSSQSWTVSASPPVRRTQGRDPQRAAMIWLSPHGSKIDGTRMMSAPA